MTDLTKTDSDADKTVRKTIADNVRAYRHLRNLDQAGLARRMYSLGMFPWSRVTVSEVERAQRSLTVAELVALTLALQPVTIEQLLDSRGPERIQGPHVALYDKPEDPDERRFHIPLPAESVLALVCTHTSEHSAPRPVAEWEDNWLSHIHLAGKAEEPAS